MDARDRRAYAAQAAVYMNEQPVERSPLGDTRNRTVECQTLSCRRPTLNWSARCNDCRAKEDAA